MSMSRWGLLSSLARNRKRVSETSLASIGEWVCETSLARAKKKVSETGLSTLRKWASDINLTRVQNGFERLVSLVYKKHLKRLVSDIY